MKEIALQVKFISVKKQDAISSIEKSQIVRSPKRDQEAGPGGTGLSTQLCVRLMTGNGKFKVIVAL